MISINGTIIDFTVGIALAAVIVLFVGIAVGRAGRRYK